MEFVAIALFVAAVLAPGIRSLLDSMAYRHRARGKAEIIRAKGEAREVAGGTVGESRGRSGG
ncbi:hypothetical protein ACFYNL_05810 [Streptomyces sp. NPDC007808]|uniref:hypothetical protein n=1 Tax=Streptomyces sp. NPDC007808 TaxID=3364779 RepID=UPI003673A50A